MTPNASMRVSYHEAALLSLVHEGAQVSLLLDDVFLGIDMGPAAVLIDQVKSIKRNSEPVNSIMMESSSAEILTLRQEAAGVALVVQWNGSAGKRFEIVTYVMEGAQLHHMPPPG